MILIDIFFIYFERNNKFIKIISMYILNNNNEKKEIKI